MITIWIAFAAIALCGNAQSISFRREFSDKVVTPFSVSIEKFDELLTILQGEFAETRENVCLIPQSVSDQLKISTAEFHDNMQICSDNSNSLVLQLDTEMESLSNEVTLVQQQINENEEKISEVDLQITGINQEIADSAQAVQQATQNLQTHESALWQARNRYNDAKNNCLGMKRRRKRDFFKDVFGGVSEVFNGAQVAVQDPMEDFFGDISKALQGVPVVAEAPVQKAQELAENIAKETYKGICATLDVFTNQIKEEKRNVENAQQALQHAQEVLQQRRNFLTQATASRAEMKQRKQQLGRTLQQQTVVLNDMKMQRDLTNDMSSQAKKTTLFLGSTLSRATVFQFRVNLGYLLDAENIVSPLEEIHDLFSQMPQLEANLPPFPSEKITQDQAALEELKSLDHEAACQLDDNSIIE